MKIAIASDHAGFQVKEMLKNILQQQHDIVDMGTDSEERCDYPDFAKKVGNAIVENQVERGILICGTGIGMSIAANKIKGIRAALCHSEETAKLSRQHNDSNVLCMGARVLSEELIKSMAQIWLSESFSGGRHQGRVDKME